MRKNSFYSKAELVELGIKNVGQDVYISSKCSIYGAENIEIGNHVRIDDFCILSGKIFIGNYVHIAAYSAFFAGDAGITMGDFSTVSSRTSLYAVSDDYSGETMTNPMIPDKYKKLQCEEIVIGENVIIGSDCVILPGAYLQGGGCSRCHELDKGKVRGLECICRHSMPTHQRAKKRTAFTGKGLPDRRKEQSIICCLFSEVFLSERSK